MRDGGRTIQPSGSQPHDRRRQRSIVPTQVIAVRQGEWHLLQDQVVAEEPLEIRVGGPDQSPMSLSVTMRTPGHDAELALGFLYSEGIIRGYDDVTGIGDGSRASTSHPCNIIAVHLTQPVDLTGSTRHFAATSSCGLCGKASIQQLVVHCPPLAPGPVVNDTVLMQLPTILRQAQHMFEQTGGVHAAGLFDRLGHLQVVREDVGRHNAVDKVVGHMLQRRAVPLKECILQVSGRLSFEIVQKAAMAGVPILSAVSAPSSLAVEAAQQFGMTLVGFIRDQRMNIYTHPERIAPAL